MRDTALYGNKKSAARTRCSKQSHQRLHRRYCKARDQRRKCKNPCNVQLNSGSARERQQNFQNKLAQRGGSSALWGESIDWLSFAGVALKCGRIEQGLMPISVYRDLASFKLYMSDVGLLTMKSGISQQTILGVVDNTYMGAITENYVAQAFAAKHYELYYWTTEGKAELDFVMQKGNEIIAVEVKTGTRTKSKSLAMFVEKYNPAYSIRISSKNFGYENNIKSVPLYAVFCI